MPSRDQLNFEEEVALLVPLIGGTRYGAVISPFAARRAMSVRWLEPGRWTSATLRYASSRASVRDGPTPTTDRTRPPAETVAPSSRRRVPAWRTPWESAPVMTSPERVRPG